MKFYYFIILFIFSSCITEDNKNLSTDDREFYHFNHCANYLIESVLDTIIFKNLDTTTIKAVIGETIQSFDTMYDISSYTLNINSESENDWSTSFNKNQYEIVAQYQEFIYVRNESKTVVTKGGIGRKKKQDELFFIKISNYYPNITAEFIIFFKGKTNIDFDEVYKNDRILLEQHNTIDIFTIDWKNVL